jgi:ATP-dependent Lhr-like helicase
MGAIEAKLIEQASDGTLMLGAGGEQIAQSRDFFAVFESSEEWRLASAGRTLGNLPISYPVHKDSLVVFAGRRWIVVSIDDQTKTLQVAQHSGGIVPKFERTSIEQAHDRLVAEMRAVYLSEDLPPYLDSKAHEILAEGRETFLKHRLSERVLIEDDGDLHVFLWRGSQATAVFTAALAMNSVAAELHDFGLTITKTSKNEAVPLLRKLVENGPPNAIDLAAFVSNIKQGKYSDFVPEGLIRKQWTQQNIALIDKIPEIAAGLIS